MWARYSTEDDTHHRGFAKAYADCEKKRSAKPGVDPAVLPVYGGFIEACVGKIRGAGAPERSEDDGEPICTPGVFDVLHVPEKDFFSHCHVELMRGYVEALRAQNERDGGQVDSDRLSAKAARVVAYQMLVYVFEQSRLVPAP